MTTSIDIHQPALVLIFRYECEPAVIAPADQRERDRILAWLVDAYPAWAEALETAARSRLESD